MNPVQKIVSGIARLTGLQRRRSGRTVGPEEGIEDAATIDSYEKLNRTPQFKIVRMIGIGGLKKLNPRGVLADLGCGPAYFTRDVAKTFPDLDLIALDISEEMLERARKNLASPVFDGRVTFRQGDIKNLPFGEGSLDFVISTLSLHHWEAPEESFREIFRVLKPGGCFMVFDTRRDSPGLFYLLMRFAQKFILPKNLIEKDEPTSSVRASYTPEETLDFIRDLPFTETKASGGIFWLFLSGRKPK